MILEIRRDQCFECGSTGDLHGHHVVPEVMGGTKTIPLCVKHHGMVHGRDMTSHAHLIKLGQAKARAEGIKWGQKPFGQHPGEEITLKRMLELRVTARKSLQDIAEALDAEGFSSRSGKPWTGQAVNTILLRSGVDGRYTRKIMKRKPIFTPNTTLDPHDL